MSLELVLKTMYNERLELIFVILTIMVWFFVYWYSHTYFHEMGHVILARFYNRNNKIGILLYKKLFKVKKDRLLKTNFLQNKLGYKVYVQNFKKGITKQNGKTFIEDDFKGYSIKELKNISIGGLIAEIIYGIFLCIITIIIFFKLSNEENLEYIYYYIIFISFCFIEIYFFINNSKSDKWTDMNIYKNTERFYNELHSGKLDKEDKYENYFC